MSGRREQHQTLQYEWSLHQGTWLRLVLPGESIWVRIAGVERWGLELRPKQFIKARLWKLGAWESPCGSPRVDCRMGGICGTDEKGKNSRENSLSQMQRDQCNRGTLTVSHIVTTISEFRH